MSFEVNRLYLFYQVFVLQTFLFFMYVNDKILTDNIVEYALLF